MQVAASFDHLPAPCATKGCPEDPAARLLFGCDADADLGYSVWCWACHGTPGGCPACEHSKDGSIELFRCPNHHATPEVVAMISAFIHYRAGFLPMAGGMQDQSATFAGAMGFLTAVVSHHEEIRMERACGK